MTGVLWAFLHLMPIWLDSTAAGVVPVLPRLAEGLRLCA
jgi:hypothetical protein